MAPDALTFEETIAAEAPLPADAGDVCEPYSEVGPYWKKYSVGLRVRADRSCQGRCALGNVRGCRRAHARRDRQRSDLPSVAISVNQTFPFGPAVIPSGWLLLVGVAVCEITPAVVILPISPGLLNSVK